MAMSGLAGPGLLGFGQARANAQNQQSQFNQIFGTNAFLEQFGGAGKTAGPIVEKQKTLREELQAEVDEWLPKLAA